MRLAVLLVLIAIAGCQSAGRVPLGDETIGLYGWYEMCQRVPDSELCKPK